MNYIFAILPGFLLRLGIASLGFSSLGISSLGISSLGDAAQARTAKNRIDLGALVPFPLISSSPYASARVGFRPTEADCPEQHGTIEIKSGRLTLERIQALRSFTIPEKETVADPDRVHHTKAIDDYSWQYQIGNAECRLSLLVRLQLNHDGQWQSMTLPSLSRPSLSKEERANVMREIQDRARERAKTEPVPPIPAPLPQSIGIPGSIGEGFFFESTGSQPPDCFQAVGTYEISREGASFTFLGQLPGGLNRFAIERDDVDRFTGRLNFVQADCRFQITVSGSTWYHFDWAPMEIDILD